MPAFHYLGLLELINLLLFTTINLCVLHSIYSCKLYDKNIESDKCYSKSLDWIQILAVGHKYDSKFITFCFTNCLYVCFVFGFFQPCLF